ncbi:MAG: TQO small subunit DoxD [Candidatus Nanopelagicales bacterium]
MTSSDHPISEHATESPVRLPDDRMAHFSAVVVRVVVGLLWVENLSWKVPPHFGADDDSGLYYFTSLAVEYPLLAPYSAVIENVVLPNFAVFGWGVFLVEIFLGLFLILGLATRFWAVVGLIQTVAIFLSVGAAPNEWKWSYFLMAAAHLAVLGFAAGRVLGVDGALRRRVTGNSLISRAYRLSS